MVGARGPGTEQIWKDALWGGGGTHRSWPGGQGGKPRALVAGEGWGGRRGWALGWGLGGGGFGGVGAGWQFQRRGRVGEK